MAPETGTTTLVDHVSLFAKQLVVAWKAVLLYPPTSAIPQQNAETALATLRQALAVEPELSFEVTKTGLTCQGQAITGQGSSLDSLALELYQRNVSELRFLLGVDAAALLAFLGTLRSEPAELAAAGGIKELLRALDVESIVVTAAHMNVVEAAETEGGFDAASVDLLLERTLSGATDSSTLQLFLGTPEQLASYLSVAGSDPDLAADRLARLAHGVGVMAEADAAEARRQIAEAIAQLEPEARRRLLAHHVLPSARRDSAVAAVVRAIDLSVVFESLLGDEPKTAAEQDGLARAIHNLAMISAADRDDLLQSAGTAMHEAGFAEETTASVLELASPSRVVLPLGDDPPETRTADTVLQMLDYAPVGHGPDATDPEAAALAAEAERGITDGDVVLALTSLVTLRRQGAHFDRTMRIIEESMPLLIDRGDLEVAAGIARQLAETSADPDTPAMNAMRMKMTIEQLVRREQVAALLRAVRSLPEGSTERDAAAELLQLFGERGLEPLLEVLAEEQDMTARKALVDMLSDLAADYIPELGGRLNDPRWYFVRNVVAVLGAAKRSATLPYLQRTLRHPDARVRRETVRAAAALPDRMATDMLAVALCDAEAQNVQLAARLLADRHAESAVPALIEVARGEGRGNRDVSVRVEAIEALGRSGAVAAVPELEALSGKWNLGSLGGRNREIRTAADAAIAQLKGVMS